MPEKTIQERVEAELDPEGLKRARAVMESEFRMVMLTTPEHASPEEIDRAASRVVAAYLLGVSEPKKEPELSCYDDDPCDGPGHCPICSGAK